MVDHRIKVDWTPALRAEALKRWEEGQTATDIAATIPGATRSGILGLVKRAGKKRKDAGACRVAAAKVSKAKPAPKVKAPPAPKPEPVKKARLPASGWNNAGTPIPGHIPPQPPAPPPLRLTLMELEIRCCRWPVSDQAPWFYCGHEVAGENSIVTPYCPHHTRAKGAKDNPNKPRTTAQLTRDLRAFL